MVKCILVASHNAWIFFNGLVQEEEYFMILSSHPGVIRRWRVPVLILGSLLLAGFLMPYHAGAQGRASAPYVNQGVLTLVSDGLAADIDPASNESEYGSTVIRNVDETLVRLAGSSLTSFEPDLATRWTSNADQSVWTFYLRHGVRFHDGRCCLTATDVQYSLARSVAANLAGSYMLGRFFTDPFKQITVVDPYTVRVTLHGSQPFFLAAAAQDYNALILDSQALKAHATKSDPYAHNWATRHDLGTGPYMLSQWVPSQQITLKQFPQYWAGWSGPHYGTIILSYIPDATTRRELMERGQAQITFDLTPQDYDAMKTNHKLSVLTPYGTELIYITMTQAGPLASPLARQALSYAFPYDALVQGIYRGYARRAYGPIPSNTLGYNPSMFHYQTDLNKAKALLQQAGVKPGTTLTYTYYPSFPNEQMGRLLQAQLGQIGITLKLQQLDYASWQNVFYGSEPASKRPNLMPYSWWPDYNEPYDMASTLLATSQQAPNGNNGGMYSNKQVDALFNQMQNATIPADVAAAQKLQTITGQVDPPSIWAAEPAQVTVLSANLRGFVFNPVELRTFYFYTMSHS